MRRLRARHVLVFVGVLAVCAVALEAAAPAKGTPPDPTRALLNRLRSAGRAEARFTRARVDPLSGDTVRVRGSLVLELPMSVLLRFPESGEKITLREDGGEWLQPRLEQMMRLGPKRAASARRWWDALVGASGARPHAARIGPRRYHLTLGTSVEGGDDGAAVTLDARGLPSLLEIDEGEDEPTRYRFEGWRFSRARGIASFRITAPRGVEVVDLP